MMSSSLLESYNWHLPLHYYLSISSSHSNWEQIYKIANQTQDKKNQNQILLFLCSCQLQDSLPILSLHRCGDGSSCDLILSQTLKYISHQQSSCFCNVIQSYYWWGISSISLFLLLSLHFHINSMSSSHLFHCSRWHWASDAG